MCNKTSIIFLCFAVSEIRNGEILWGTPWNGTDTSVKAEYANVQN